MTETGGEAGTGPPVVCIVGKKNSGKTTVAIMLLAELKRRGRRVMSVKHGHGFELDRPGSDSWRHVHEGGAQRVVMVGPAGMGAVGVWDASGEPDLMTVVGHWLHDAELVVAEGWKGADAPKIEIFRSAVHRTPILDPATARAEGFIAIVTDGDPFDAGVPVLHFDDPALALQLADLVEALLPERSTPA